MTFEAVNSKNINPLLSEIEHFLKWNIIKSKIPHEVDKSVLHHFFDDTFFQCS
jgi:hypothetical protein